MPRDSEPTPRKRGPPHRAPRQRLAAIKLANEGLATIAEISRLAGVSRQLARYWLGGIDVSKRRQAHLQRLWRETIKHGERS
jgi:transposase-like protein